MRTMNKLRWKQYIVLMAFFSMGSIMVSCQPKGSISEEPDKTAWNPPVDFRLIDKETSGSLAHLKVSPNLDSAAIRQLVYVAVNTDIYIRSKEQRLPLTNTLCIRNVSVDQPMIVNHVDYYDAEGIKLKDYLAHPVELRPLQSIWLILEGQNKQGGTGTNFLIDWGSMKPIPDPIIESLMAGSSYQLGLSFKSESVVVKEWRYGVESKNENHR